MDNVSFHRFFILDGFNELGGLRPFLFIPFFFLLVVSILFNFLLLSVIVKQRSLHSPMYILIAVISCVDVSLPLFFIPGTLLNFLFGWRSISLIGCLAQMNFIHLLGAYQSTVLLLMAVDRYLAICRPLHYKDLTTLSRFLRLAVPLGVRNVFLTLLVVSLAGRLPFCRSNVINHCFCEHMALVEVACGSTRVNNLVGLSAVVLIPVADFIIITISYIVIFRSVLSSGKSSIKALHTCVTHMVVMAVSMTVILTAFLSYRIGNHLPPPVRVFISITYLFLPSCVNPIIYGIRTAEIRRHILDVLTRHGFTHTANG